MFPQLSTTASDYSSKGTIDQRCSIFNLPDELLCIVLAAVASAEQPTGPYPFLPTVPEENRTRCKALGFLRLSEVCTRFRALLLSMPSVWASVIFKLPVEPSKLALLRSHSHPLSVSLREPFSVSATAQTKEARNATFRHFVSVASQHAGRIRLLEIENGATLFKTQPFANQLLFLEELDLSYHYSKDPFNGLEHSYINAPNVRRAHFFFSAHVMHDICNKQTGIGFVFPSLRFLKITLEDVDVESASDLEWILDLLQASPLIETIHFPFELLIDEAGTWDALFRDRDIQLKHLRVFELTGYTPSDMALYTHVCPARPPRCILNYEPIHLERDETMDGAMQFATSFGHLLQNPSYGGLFLELSTSDESESVPLQIGVFPVTDDTLGRPKFTDGMSEIVSLRLPSAFEIDDTIDPQVFDALAAVLKHNEIKQLVLEIPFRDDDDWPYAIDVMLQACSKVTQLAIRRFLAINMTEFVVPMLPGLLPCLDTVHIEPVYWDSFTKKATTAGTCLCRGWNIARATVFESAGLHIRGARHPADAEDAAHEKDRTMCARAARHVDELFDERVGRA